MRFSSYRELWEFGRLHLTPSLLRMVLVVMVLFRPGFALANDPVDLIGPNRTFVLSGEEAHFIQSLAPLRVMIDDNFVPLSYYNSRDHSFQGISVDIFRHLAERLGLKYQFVHDAKLSWADKVELFKNQKVDLLMPVSYTPERAAAGIFTTGFYDTFYGAIAKKTSGIKLRDSYDLANYRVGVTKASAIISFLQQFVPSSRIVQYDNQADLYQGVRSGQVDIALQNKHVFKEDRFKLGFVDLALFHTIVESPRRYSYYLSKSESSQMLTVIINRYLAGIDFSRLTNHYEQGEDELVLLYTEQKHQKKLLELGIIGALMLLALLGVAYLNHRRFTARLAASLEQAQLQQENLQRSEAKQRAMIENIVDVIAIIDQRVINRYMSPNIEKWFGWHPDDVIGEVTGKNIHPDDRHDTQKVFDTLLGRADTVITAECRYLCKDGSYKWIGYTAINLLHDPDVAGVLLSFHDITERRRMEYELRHSEEQSRNNAHLLQSVIEHFPGVVFWKNAELVYLGCNRAFSGAAGLTSPSEIVGKSDQDMPWAETEASIYCSSDQLVMQSGEAKLHIIETQHQADGRVAWFDTCKVPLRDDQGNIWGVMGASFDISDLKRAEEERLQLEQQFHHAQRLESLGVLAGGIAHDFNNILTVILGHCFLAGERKGVNPDNGHIESFKQIETAAHRAADLCRQMLTYAGKSPLVQTRVNLLRLVDEMVKMLQFAISKNVAFELDLDHDVPEIQGDTSQIQQVVMNLIINASEAIGDANGTIRVVLSKMTIDMDQLEADTFEKAIPTGRYVYLEVSDNGSGMDVETQRRIFEPFYTTKFAGRGLGMSAIRGIVKSHEGALQLSSSPGIGTSFKICFPAPEVPVDSVAASTGSDLNEKAGGNVLLVDDEQSLRTMGVVLLETLGFSAMTAQHGLEALDIYRERGDEIDVILLDLVMPVMGGLETYRKLRIIDSTLPIIICSGYSAESVLDEIGNDQHAGFMHKPYNPDQLREKIMQLMV